MDGFSERFEPLGWPPKLLEMMVLMYLCLMHSYRSSIKQYNHSQMVFKLLEVDSNYAFFNENFIDGVDNLEQNLIEENKNTEIKLLF